MRTQGRRVFAESPAEQRVLSEFGDGPLYVPRGVSPFVVVRRLSRAARHENPDVLFVRHLLKKPGAMKLTTVPTDGAPPAPPPPRPSRLPEGDHESPSVGS